MCSKFVYSYIVGHCLSESMYNLWFFTKTRCSYPNQRVTVCGLIIVSRSHLQHNGQPMKFISICDRTGIVECEIFAAAYRLYGLNTIRYPVVQVTAEVKPFDNGAGYTLDVLQVEQPRKVSGE